MFVAAEAAVMVHPPTIAVGSSVGAGDAMVAGIAAGLGDGLPLAALARRAAAFSAAKLQQAGAATARPRRGGGDRRGDPRRGLA